MKGLLALSIFLPAFFCSHKTKAQDSASRFSVLLSPALFYPVSVAVQGGLEYKISKRWSMLVEAAVPAFHPKNTVYEEINCWRTGVEIKRRLDKMRPSKTYVSLQNNYLFRRLVDKEAALYYTKTQTYSYQNAVIHSPVLSSAIKLGAELPAGKKIFVDAFAGIGLRFIFTNYKSEKSLLTSVEPEKQNFLKFDDAWLFNYTLTRFHLTAGLRFGIRL